MLKTKISFMLLLLFAHWSPAQTVKPAATTTTGTRILFYDPLHNTGLLKDALSAVVAYDVSPLGETVDKNALLITTIFDDQVSRHLQSGGRAIILCNSLNAFPEGAPFKVKARDLSTGNSGTKIADAGPFAGLGKKDLDPNGYKAVEPGFVIANLRGEIPEDIFARASSAGPDSNPIAAMQLYAAGGRVFVTTYRLEGYGGNSYATCLLDSIITYTTGPNFAPKYDWHIREE